MTLQFDALFVPYLLAHLGHSGPLFALIIGGMLLPLVVVFALLARNEKQREDASSGS